MTLPIAQENLCRFCNDVIYLMPRAEVDEYLWCDERGSTVGTDADIREYVPTGTSAYEHLNRIGAQSRRDQRSAQMYAALLVRLDTHATQHTHYPRLPVWTGRGPDHCAYPMWLRPSGWHCRKCPFVLL